MSPSLPIPLTEYSAWMALFIDYRRLLTSAPTLVYSPPDRWPARSGLRFGWLTNSFLKRRGKEEQRESQRECTLSLSLSAPLHLCVSKKKQITVCRRKAVLSLLFFANSATPMSPVVGGHGLRRGTTPITGRRELAHLYYRAPSAADVHATIMCSKYGGFEGRGVAVSV